MSWLAWLAAWGLVPLWDMAMERWPSAWWLVTYPLAVVYAYYLLGYPYMRLVEWRKRRWPEWDE